MSDNPLHLTAHIDGGARGNPGPAGAGAILTDPQGRIHYQGGVFIPHATNNVAEYTALLTALQAAAKLGARGLDVASDSELLVCQMTGRYRVRNEGLRPLFSKAQQLAEAFETCTFRHVRREQNVEADALANRAMDARANVGDAR